MLCSKHMVKLYMYIDIGFKTILPFHALLLGLKNLMSQKSF